ncbi:MAG: hypothetical protein GY854_21330, partial [Deltaproteobacteria bacterium]|nr:hypothetical protein [Deltaproteobacteria bacterium]
IARLLQESHANGTNCFIEPNKLDEWRQRLARLPLSSDDVNTVLVRLQREKDTDVLRARLFYLIIYIRGEERSLHSSTTTEGDTVVASIERNLIDLLDASTQLSFKAIYPQLRELAAIAPKMRVFGININEIREDVACYHENRDEDDPFCAVAEAIREATHRRLCAKVIVLINELDSYLRSDQKTAFVAYRYCSSTQEQKDEELASTLYTSLLGVREQLRLIWNDPFSGTKIDSTADGGYGAESLFFSNSIEQTIQLIAPFKKLLVANDHHSFAGKLAQTVKAIDSRRFHEMRIGTTRDALKRLIFELAGLDHPSKGRALFSLMTLDCILENLSLVYYSNIVNSELAVVTSDNYGRVIKILPELVLCAIANGQGTAALRQLALEMKTRIASAGTVSRVEAQILLKEMSEELQGFVYNLSKFVTDLLNSAHSANPSERNDPSQVRLLNDIVREKTTHLCANLMSSLILYLGGEGSPLIRQLATVKHHMLPDNQSSEPTVDNAIFHFGPDIVRNARDVEDIWFMGRKGASESSMSRIVRERNMTNVDVPRGFGLCTRTWSMVSGSPANETALKDVIRSEVEVLEQRTGKHFGKPNNPLLLIVRSGAILSMPGILPTIGHIGLNQGIVEQWSETLDESYRAHHAYLRFLFNYAEIVFANRGVTVRSLYRGLYSNRIADLCVADITVMHDTVDKVRRNIADATGGLQVPDDPFDQLIESVFTVFSSYNFDTIVAHHAELRSIPEHYQTACLIQDCLPMFSAQDCSGIYLTRNPLDGGEEQIEYIHDFGEDLAGGRASPESTRKFRSIYPSQYDELKQMGRFSEEKNSSPMDVEFAIRFGKLYILQARPLTLAPMADVVTAYKMYRAGLMSVTDLIQRTRRVVGRPLINTFMTEIDKQSNTPIASGQPIAGGVVAGRIVFNAKNIKDYPGEHIIFIAKSNVPKMAGRKSGIDGYISEEGGVTSHAALVSVGKLPCIVGVKWRKYGKGIHIGNDAYLKEGDVITLDANDGYIYQGRLPVLASPENHPEYLEAERAILAIAQTLEDIGYFPPPSRGRVI